MIGLREKGAALLLWLASAGAGCASAERLTARVDPAAAPALVGFSPAEAERFDDTWRALCALEARPLRVPSATYRRLARFEEDFGFAFDGPALCRWVAARVDRVVRVDGPLALQHGGGQVVEVGAAFFEATLVERLYALIHEARHSEGATYRHRSCPDDFPFVSAAQPELALAGAAACDDRVDGAYGLQAAFLLELWARGLVDPQLAGHLYNASIARVVPPDRR